MQHNFSTQTYTEVPSHNTLPHYFAFGSMPTGLGNGMWLNVSTWQDSRCLFECFYRRSTQYGPKVSCLTYKSRAKWKMLWGIYSAIYGEVNVSVEKCVEIKGRLCWKIAKLFYFCHLKKLVRPESFGPYYVRTSFIPMLFSVTVYDFQIQYA